MASPPTTPPAISSDAATDHGLLGHGAHPVRFESHALSPPSMFLAVVLIAFLISGCVSLLVRAFSSTAAMALLWRASHPPLPHVRSAGDRQQYAAPMAQRQPQQPRQQGYAVSGLEPSHISSLPVEDFSRDVIKKQAGCGYCVVCLSEFGEGEAVRILPACMHCFHADCIGTWLHSHSTCPVCRHSLLSLSPVSCWPGHSAWGLEQCILQTWTCSTESPTPTENRLHGCAAESLAQQSSESLAGESTQPLPSNCSMPTTDSSCKESFTDRRPSDPNNSETARAAGCMMGASFSSHGPSSLESCVQLSGCTDKVSASVDHGCLAPSVCSMSSHGPSSSSSSMPTLSSSSSSSSLSMSSSQAAAECYSAKTHNSMQQGVLPECCVNPAPPGKGLAEHIVHE